jgi:hypothetical protein
MNETSSLLERLSEEAVWRLEEACCRFEEAWQAGQRPSLEDFVAGSEEMERLALLRELLRLEVYYRRRAGEGPSAADYQTRFPEATAVLQEVFAAPTDPDGTPAPPRPEADDPERTGPDEGHPLKAGQAGVGADAGLPRMQADAGSTVVGLSSSAGATDDADPGRPLPGAPPADLPRDVGRYCCRDVFARSEPQATNAQVISRVGHYRTPGAGTPESTGARGGRT